MLSIEEYYNGFESSWRRFCKWFYPGMRVKRWILLMVLGGMLAAGGGPILIGPEPVIALGRTISNYLRAIGQSNKIPLIQERGAAVAVLGIVLICLGFRQVIRSLIQDILPADPRDLPEIIFYKRGLGREPAVVVIGGGTGLSTMLRGLKLKTDRITAIVTVADDGGSSGRIRSELGIPPPGDIRNTLVALANTEPLMEQLFQYRFDWGEGLEGHSFGNLFIAAMTDITGDFEEAIRTSSQVLAVRGQVLPSTLNSVTLRAEYDDGSTTTGESLIPQPGKQIRRVFLEPENCQPLEEVIAAIDNADAVILGPGSLYTSVLPNLLVPEIREAVRRSTVPKIYICNVMTQPGETDGYKASHHVEALLSHVGPGLIDYVIINTAAVPHHLLERYRQQGAVPVEPDTEAVAVLGVTPIAAEVISMTNLVRHDPEKLAEVISQIVSERTSAGKLGKLVKQL